MDYIPIPKFASGYSGNNFAGFAPDTLAAMQKFNPDFAKASQDELQNQMKKGEGGSYSASNSIQHTEPTGEAKKSAAYINAFNEEQAFWRDQQNRYLSGDPTNVIDRMTFNDQTALATQLPGRSFLNGGVYIDSSGRQQNAPIRTMPAPKDPIAVNQSTYDAMQGSMNVSADNKYAPASAVPKQQIKYVTPNVPFYAEDGQKGAMDLGVAGAGASLTDVSNRSLSGMQKMISDIKKSVDASGGKEVTIQDNTKTAMRGAGSTDDYANSVAEQILKNGERFKLYTEGNDHSDGEIILGKYLNRMPASIKKYYTNANGYLEFNGNLQKAFDEALASIYEAAKNGDMNRAVFNIKDDKGNVIHKNVNAEQFLVGVRKDFLTWAGNIDEYHDWAAKVAAAANYRDKPQQSPDPNSVYQPGMQKEWGQQAIENYIYNKMSGNGLSSRHFTGRHPKP